MPVRTPRLLFVVTALLTLSSCGGCGAPRGIARVGETALHEEDLALERQRGARGAAKGDLERLVDRALLAEGAREAGLLDDPVVRAKLAAAQREVLAEALVEKRTAALVTDEALQARFAEQKTTLTRRRIHVRHIVVRGTDDAAKGRATTLAARVHGGDDFAELAKASSDDAASAARGGELPPILEGQVDGRFFDAAVELVPGAASAPVATPFGFHIIEALEPATTVEPRFEEVKGKLAADARRDAVEKLAASLRATIRVDVTAPSPSGPATPAR